MKWVTALLVIAIFSSAGLARAQDEKPEQPVEPEEPKPVSPDGKRSSLDYDENIGFVPVGAVLYAPETSVTFAAAALVYYRLGQPLQVRDSKTMLAAAYTLKSQWLLQLSGTLFAFRDNVALDYEIDVSYFPKVFYGIGNDTSLDDDEDYVRRAYQVQLRPGVRLAKNLYVGPASRLKHYRISEIEPGRQLASGNVLGSEGGTDVGLGVGGFYDTREPSMNPLHGVFVDLEFTHSGPTWASDFEFQTYSVDVRGYVPIFRRLKHVLALQAYGEFHSGEPPFWMLSELGGPSRMRGHYQGRYRDRQMLAVQAEYRLPIVWRLGAVAFGGLGDVARNLGDFRAKETKFSVGGGLRLMLDRDSRVNLRADAAWAGDSWGPYVSLGEAF
jgi:hypothetical protein